MARPMAVWIYLAGTVLSSEEMHVWDRCDLRPHATLAVYGVQYANKSLGSQGSSVFRCAGVPPHCQGCPSRGSQASQFAPSSGDNGSRHGDQPRAFWNPGSSQASAKGAISAPPFRETTTD